MEDTNPTYLNFALDTCKAYVNRHNVQASIFLAFIIVIPLFTASYFFINNNREYRSHLGLSEEINNKSSPLSQSQIDALLKLTATGTTKIDYILYGFLIVAFGIFTSFYRFHLKEVAKYEHFLLGFARIQIAASNSQDSYETEVRQSLTHDAFHYETKSSFITNEKRIKSPLPGVPSSDIASAIINKVLDSVEIIGKKNSK
ncbi:MAG: hypothetical protein BGO70_12170 [Bacteroidetes bacterium 43-93]|nr:hypothetical protein [Bacteroidota bacterium]OJW98211.1 MAG: hypothetical protein BGO70_12170 [Bacteroidetes bacterium 43-93]